MIADNLQPTFNSAQQAYVLPAGQTSMNVSVQAITAGSAYNVQANTLTQIATTLFGLPKVNNALPIQTGANAETDAEYRARFVEYLNSLSKATETAILEAIQAVESGLKIALFENVLAVGQPVTSFISPYYGNIVAIIDDGSGNPSAGLMSAVSNAVNATRAFSIQYQVKKPTIIIPTIQLNVRVDSDYVSTRVETAVQLAIVALVNAYDIGGTLFLSQIELAAMSTPGVIAVEPESLLINGLEQDLALQPWQEALITVTNVAVGTY